MTVGNLTSSLTRRQEKRRDQLANQYFGQVSQLDFMVAESGRNGVVRVGSEVIIKATHGGFFRKPTFDVIRMDRIVGIVLDQSVGAEDVTLLLPSGPWDLRVYNARGICHGPAGVLDGKSDGFDKHEGSLLANGGRLNVACPGPALDLPYCESRLDYRPRSRYELS